MEPTKRPVGIVSPQYQALYKYLDSRFADMVVLTFAQIEDILGSTLPDLARQEEGWWANIVPHTTPPPQAQSWIVANRSALPNLRAHIVSFERLP